MMESAFVFDVDGVIIHWHLPANRSGGFIPDSRDLWEVLWENREKLGGIAHTHPWNGEPWPSGTDVTTFAACEAALGKRLLWPVVTLDRMRTFRWVGPSKLDYAPVALPGEESFEALRQASR